mmetsp:Transcript_16110/g.24341  ORF Transcript_16110/g.24341 Transcript_16110/m.24341 type:complete len:386 (+) Transcript_16110:108-1265(+)
MAPSRVLVVGSGAIGLRTAVELLRRNVEISLVSPFSPLHESTCSQGAGGLWMPFHCNENRVDRWSKETLNELYPMAKDSSNTLVESLSCVVMKQSHSGPLIEDFLASDYDLGTGGKSTIPLWTKDERIEFQHLTAEMLHWQNTIYNLKIPSQEAMIGSKYQYAWHFKTPVVDAPNMLKFMLREIQNHKNTAYLNVETNQYYRSIDEIANIAKTLDCDAVVNCTGLGSRELCQDDLVVGARGILLHFDRKKSIRTFKRSDNSPLTNDAVILVEEGPWGNESHPCYLIPRGDVLVVGGTYLEGDDNKSITPQERELLLEKAQILGIDVKASPPIGEWVGFRPSRKIAKCEVDKSVSDLQIVHSYGYGGSGWTVSVGVAKETAKLLNV